jgi:hypothetical protein
MSSTDPRRPADPTRSPTPPDVNSLPEIVLGGEGTVDLGDLKSSEGSIDLTSLPEAPSGQSLTSWTAVIKRQKQQAEAAGTGAAAPVRVDAPSDKDLLERLAAQARKPGDTKEIPSADLPLFTAPTGRSESDIDLGNLAMEAGTGESEVKFDILYPPSDAGGVMPAPQPPLSAVDFRNVPLADPTSGILLSPDAGPASGVLLGADTGEPGEGGRSSILDALLNGPEASNSSASVLEFGSEVAPPASHPSTPEVGGREIVDSDAGTGSEEAIDLYAEPAPAPSITDSGTLEISKEALAENQRRTEAEESSSVDLSSRPSLHSGEFDQALDAASRGLQSDADIDLNLPASDDKGDSSMVYRQNGLDANSQALAAEFEARRKKGERKARRGDVVPARERPERVRSGGYLIHGGVIGLLLGAGAVLAAHFAGVLPTRKADANSAQTNENRAPAPDYLADLNRMRGEAAQTKVKLDELSADAKKNADEVARLSELKAASDAEVKTLRADAEKARNEVTATLKKARDAEAAEQTARTDLTAAKKTAMEAAAAKLAADTTLSTLTKSLRDAGIDPAKPGDALKTLTDARAAAEVKVKEAEARAKDAADKAKEADAKVADATKKANDQAAQAETAKKSADDARKMADDAVKARQAGEATVQAIVDRLVKAKFVGEKTDGPALLKGIDDALKAGSTDATATLRAEITKLRADSEKAQAELVAAKDRETKAVQAAQERETKAVQAAQERETKAVQAATDREAAAVKGAAEAKAESQRERDAARAEAERATAEVARLKAETERLTRDLAVVQDLAALIKNQVPTTGPGTKVDPARLADQFFGDGLHSYFGGRYAEAESELRKAIQFRAADARYHYLLGLTLWMKNEKVAADTEFEKGRNLESQGLPSSRVVSASLERIQGPARQAVDSYRP